VNTTPHSPSYPGVNLSFVMPAYNEEDNIEKAVRVALETLPRLVSAYEIIVVNDGSSDTTGAILRRLEAENPAVRPLHHPTNHGYGAALRTGFLAARFPLVFYTDSDMQFDITEIKFILPLHERYDIITGFRIYRFDPVIRCILSWGYNRLVRLLFGIRVRDVDCAFKLFKREIFDHITIESNNFFVDTEVLAKGRAAGYSINEIGVKHFPRPAGRATVRSSDIPRTLRELARIWKSIHSTKKKPAP
jgi:glycosyltransferase involved in cell wall biosynthesis